jgi:chorismate-pyruvate lyase
MVTLNIKRQQFSNYMLHAVWEFESRLQMKLSVFTKILLSETGILDQILGLIINSETKVELIKQKETSNIITRQVYIIDEKTKKRLIYAKSKIYTVFLPRDVTVQIRSKKIGLGKIIIDAEMEIFRRNIKIGYESKTGNFFRVSNILVGKKIAFEIKEVFLFSDLEIKSLVRQNHGPGGI